MCGLCNKNDRFCLPIKKIIVPLHPQSKRKGSYQSGQMGQTVNLLAFAFGGSNPSLPTFRKQDKFAEVAQLIEH